MSSQPSRVNRPIAWRVQHHPWVVGAPPVPPGRSPRRDPHRMHGSAGWSPRPGRAMGGNPHWRHIRRRGRTAEVSHHDHIPLWRLGQNQEGRGAVRSLPVCCGHSHRRPHLSPRRRRRRRRRWLGGASVGPPNHRIPIVSGRSRLPLDREQEQGGAGAGRDGHTPPVLD